MSEQPQPPLPPGRKGERREDAQREDAQRRTPDRRGLDTMQTRKGVVTK